MSSFRRWTPSLVLAVALVLGAVSIPRLAAGAPVDQDVQTVEIALSEYAFGPSEPTVTPGTSRLRIVNAGIRRHNLIVQVEGVERASPEVRPGDVVEWDVQIERPGRYLFWCGEYRHPEKGMTGTLLVESQNHGDYYSMVDVSR